MSEVREDAVSDWQSARSLEDLGNLTVRWLRGDLPDTPTQGGPPDDETIELTNVLIWLNGLGLVTEFSQPARGLDDQGCAQRAAFSGFCSPAIAESLYALSLCSDLLVITGPAQEPTGYQIPISIQEYRPFSWCGCYHPDEVLDLFLGGTSPEATAALLKASYVSVIDPVWGREDYLWSQVRRALTDGVAPFSATSAHEE